MNKIRKILAVLFVSATVISFTSCDILSKLFVDVGKDIIGDPVAEQCFLQCGITHNMTISGSIAFEEDYCEYIELKPLEAFGTFYAYNKENGETKYLYKGHFFYQENLEDPEKGEFWVEITFLWDTKENKWIVH